MQAVAERALKFASDHPVPKLLGLSWMALMSVAGPIYVCRKDRADLQRLGAIEDPPATLQLTDSTCALVNTGARSVAEATIVFRTFFVDATECGVPFAALGSHVNPDASVRDLAPRDRLTAEYPTKRLAEECEFGQTRDCRATHDCAMVVECEARYHRQVDMQPFTKTARALVAKDCSRLRPIGGLYSYQAVGGE